MKQICFDKANKNVLINIEHTFRYERTESQVFMFLTLFSLK